jgi:hypothetical protein
MNRYKTPEGADKPELKSKAFHNVKLGMNLLFKVIYTKICYRLSR